MRKLFTFLLAVAFVTLGNVGITKAQCKNDRPGYYKAHHFEEDFNDERFPEGWSILKDKGNAVYGKNVTPTITTGGFMHMEGSGSGTRGGEIKFPTPQTNPDPLVSKHSEFVFECEWTFHKADIALNPIALMLLGSNSDLSASSSATNPPIKYADVIMGIYVVGDDGFFHFWNQDLIGKDLEGNDLVELGGVPEVFQGVYNQGWSNFIRTGADINYLNESTRTDIPFENGKTYHVTVEMDFENKVVKRLAIAEVVKEAEPGDPEPEEPVCREVLNMPFISDQVSDLAIMSCLQTRQGGTSTSANLNVDFDNIAVYAWELSKGKGDVMVYFKDQDDKIIKSYEMKGQEVGLEYKSPALDKQTFTQDGIYYAYNELASIPNVLVKEDGGKYEVVLKFKGTSAETEKEFIWTGAMDNEWNQLSDNFTVDGGTTNIAYQKDAKNGVSFSKEDAANKDVNLTEIFNLQDRDVIISAEGYNLSGSGRLEGEGGFYISKDATIGITNKLTGGIHFTGNTLTIENEEAGAKLNMKAGSVLRVGNTNFSKPIDANGGSLTIIQPEGVSDKVISSTIANASDLKYVVEFKGGYSSFSFHKGLTRINSIFDGPIDVTTTVEGDTAFFSMTAANPGALFNLGENVCLVYGANPGKASTSSVAATGTSMDIGAISGVAGSYIAGNRLTSEPGRYLTWNVGKANTDAVFAGEFFVMNDQKEIYTDETYGGGKYKDGVEKYRIIEQNFNKVGTGTWTLTGESPRYFGNFTVSEGTLELGGTLGGSSALDGPLTVAMDVKQGATLRGLGGHLTGSLNMADATYEGSLTIDAKDDISFFNVAMKMHVGAYLDGGYDKLTVSNASLVFENSTLEITTDRVPYGDTKIQLIAGDEAFGVVGEFTSVTVNGTEPIMLPSYEMPEIPELGKYYWLTDTYELAYFVNNLGIDSENATKEVASEKYYDLTGKELPKDAKGFAVKKTTYVDGSVSNEKVFIK